MDLIGIVQPRADALTLSKTSLRCYGAVALKVDVSAAAALANELSMSLSLKPRQRDAILKSFKFDIKL
eukprot:s3453_g19.t1